LKDGDKVVDKEGVDDDEDEGRMVLMYRICFVVSRIVMLV
jgi:hypothetical protein